MPKAQPYKYVKPPFERRLIRYSTGGHEAFFREGSALKLWNTSGTPTIPVIFLMFQVSHVINHAHVNTEHMYNINLC